MPPTARSYNSTLSRTHGGASTWAVERVTYLLKRSQSRVRPKREEAALASRCRQNCDQHEVRCHFCEQHEDVPRNTCTMDGSPLSDMLVCARKPRASKSSEDSPVRIDRARQRSNTYDAPPAALQRRAGMPP